jgi:hypothetical protein
VYLDRINFSAVGASAVPSRKGLQHSLKLTPEPQAHFSILHLIQKPAVVSQIGTARRESFYLFLPGEGKCHLEA